MLVASMCMGTLSLSALTSSGVGVSPIKYSSAIHVTLSDFYISWLNSRRSLLRSDESFSHAYLNIYTCTLILENRARSISLHETIGNLSVKVRPF
jgi:hypothetical protein